MTIKELIKKAQKEKAIKLRELAKATKRFFKEKSYNFTKKRVVGDRGQVFDSDSSTWYWMDNIPYKHLNAELLLSLPSENYNEEETTVE